VASWAGPSRLVVRLRRWLSGEPSEAPDSVAPRPELERPWLVNWQWVPKRSAGPGFGPHDYARARARGAEVARATLGDPAWERLRRQGYLEIRSCCLVGLTYRLRVGRRIQLIWDSLEAAERSPWPFDYLCVNPTYPLPAIEYLAQLFLYLRDRESEVIRVAAPQPFDQPLGRVF